MDECYVCIDGDAVLDFPQRAFIHNPVKFKFGAFPSNITLTIDFADGMGPVTIAPSTTRTSNISCLEYAHAIPAAMDHAPAKKRWNGR
jgi:hypothetical protein